METTYGNRLHKQLLPSIDELYDIVNATMERRGNIIIPIFALERAQEILYYLRGGMNNHRIKYYTNVFLDSPMAINRINGGAIIMAGSGMCNGGRIRHHLKHNIWNKTDKNLW